MANNDALFAAGFIAKPNASGYGQGTKFLSVFYNKTIATGAGTNNLHILASNLTLLDRICSIVGNTPALTGATDNDIGFYRISPNGTFNLTYPAGHPEAGKTVKLQAISGNALLSSVTLASALSYRDLLNHFAPSLDLSKNIGEHLGLQNFDAPIGGVFLGLLVKVASTATSEVLNLRTDIQSGF
jgi:hypothetical protein